MHIIKNSVYSETWVAVTLGQELEHLFSSPALLLEEHCFGGAASAHAQCVTGRLTANQCDTSLHQLLLMIKLLTISSY